MKLLFPVWAIMILLNPFGAQGDDNTKREKMTARRMTKIIKDNCKDVQLQGNVIQFSLHDVPAMLVYDETADRMRIISPIVAVKDLKPGEMEKAMAANFHTVLDARYAISDGLVWSAFIHPLSPLTEAQLKSALQQVIIAHATFGKEFTSGNLVFPGTKAQDDEDKQDEKQIS